MKKINKIKKRGGIIILNSVRSFLPAFFSIVLSLLIVRTFSEDLWGSFVKYTIFILSASLFYNFGSREFLLKEFSLTPSKINVLFSESFSSRIPFLILTIIFCLLFYPSNVYFPLITLLISGYLYHSIITLLIYEKQYLTSILIEVFTFSLFFVCIVFYKPINIQQLLIIFSLQFLFKTLLYIVLIKSNVLFSLKFIFSIYHLKKIFPFFLIAAIGFLNTKVDLFIITYFRTNEDIAIYQIITYFFTTIQSFSVIIALPFIKYIYRAKNSSLYKIEKTIRIYSIPLIIFGLLFTYFIMSLLFNINYSFAYYLFGFIIILPSYYLLIRYFILYRDGKEKIITKISLIASIVNLICSLILLKLDYGLIGVLSGSVIAAIVTLFMFSTISNDNLIINEKE